MAYYDRSYSIMELEVLHMIGSSHICVIYKKNVRFDYCDSSKLDVKCGLLQGLISGFFLVLLYLNNIGNVSKILKNVLFADNTTFFCSCTDVAELNLKVKYELAKLKF